MEICELIERLQEMQELYGEEAQVFIATQPNYPLAFDISGVSDTEFQEDSDDEKIEEPRIYITTSSGSPHKRPYAPRDAWYY